MKRREREWVKAEMNNNKNEMKWIDNEIGNEGVKILSEVLKINTSLTSLNLERDEKKWNVVRR